MFFSYKRLSCVFGVNNDVGWDLGEGMNPQDEDEFFAKMAVLAIVVVIIVLVGLAQKGMP